MIKVSERSEKMLALVVKGLRTNFSRPLSLKNRWKVYWAQKPGNGFSSKKYVLYHIPLVAQEINTLIRPYHLSFKEWKRKEGIFKKSYLLYQVHFSTGLLLPKPHHAYPDFQWIISSYKLFPPPSPYTPHTPNMPLPQHDHIRSFGPWCGGLDSFTHLNYPDRPSHRAR